MSIDYLAAAAICEFYCDEQRFTKFRYRKLII